MPFIIPTFNLVCNVYTNGTYPGAPRITPNCNLAYGRRVFTQFWDWNLSGQPGIFSTVLFPAFTDIRGFNDAGGSDTIEIPAGSGRVYLVVFVDDLGKGFPNEHRFCLAEQLIPWPTPIP